MALTREQEELLQELDADPEYRWAAAVIRAMLDPNRALVDDLGRCQECGEFWYHAVTCSRNVERMEGEHDGEGRRPAGHG